jgi:hypothetical protein
VGYAEDCAKIKRDISAMSENIRSIRNSQEGIFLQMEVTKDQIALLKENIRVLKSDGVVAVASEYKKAKKELVLARAYLIGLVKTYNEVTSSLKHLQPQLLRLVSSYNALTLVTGTVLRGNFKGPKNGQK